jgi:hypothetical protein
MRGHVWNLCGIWRGQVTQSTYTHRVQLGIDWTGERPKVLQAEVCAKAAPCSGDRSSKQRLALDSSFLEELVNMSLEAPIPDSPVVSLGWRVREASLPELLRRYPSLPMAVALPNPPVEEIDF